MCWLLSVGTARGQLSATTFETFSQFQNNNHYINPATVDTSFAWCFQLNNRMETGALRNVNHYFFDFDYRLKNKRSDESHYIGIQGISTQLGDFISKGRAHLRYSWYKQLAPSTYLSAGASLGLVNYAFQTSHAGSGGSDSGPDGGVGAYLMGNGYSVGFSIQQIFSSNLAPVNQAFDLSRLFNLSGSKSFELSAELVTDLYCNMQLQANRLRSYAFGSRFIWREQGIISINNFNLNKTSINLGVQRIEFLGVLSSLILTYSFHHSEASLPGNSIEIYLAVQK